MANRDRYGLSRRDQGGLLPFGSDLFMSPFSMMRRMADEMNQLFNAGVGGVNNVMSTISGFPSVDVRETAGSFVVEAELPGVNPQDVDVQVQGDNLIIRGHTQRSNESQDQGYYMTERRYGQFFREIPLPGPVDVDHCSAHFENGVLEVRMPKTEQSTGHRIPVGGQQHAGMKGGSSADKPDAIPSGENAVSQGQVESSPENQGWPGENQSGLSAQQEAQAFMGEQGSKGGQSGQSGQSQQMQPGQQSQQGQQGQQSSQGKP